jgi:tRNA(fMet)-specific endonuclease VapC
MFCLDTNILIFFIKNKSAKLNDLIFQNFAQKKIVTTSVTAAEFLYYSYKNKATKSLEKRQEVLALMQVLDFDYKSAQIFAMLKVELEESGLKKDDLDLQIASICLARGLTLITNNTKHFEDISGLRVGDWSV